MSLFIDPMTLGELLDDLGLVKVRDGLYFSSVVHIDFIVMAIIVVDIIALDMGESPTKVASEVWCRHMVCIVKGCVLSSIFLVGPSSMVEFLLQQFRTS